MPAILGIDLGQKRVGLAVSDELGMIASPLSVVLFSGRKQLAEEIKKVVESYRIEKVVVGLPKNLKGEESIAAQKVSEHVEKLKEMLGLEWILWDERLSTAEVEKLLISADVSRKKRKEVRDALAAQRILQSYLDYSRMKASGQ